MPPEHISSITLMLNFRLTPDAKTNLFEILRYTLHQWGATQSERYLSELRHKIRLLAENPYLGTSRPEVSMDLLSFPHSSHIIYHLVLKDQYIRAGSIYTTTRHHPYPRQ